MLWKILIGIVAIAVLFTVGLYVYSFMYANKMPGNLGITNDGRLATCPDKPNCVSSFETKDRHKIQPITWKEGISAEENMALLEKSILSMEGAKVLKKEGHYYLHATYTTRFMKFVDDLEVLADGEAEVFHIRSASRLGYSDRGVNRKRVEKLRAIFLEAE